MKHRYSQTQFKAMVARLLRYWAWFPGKSLVGPALIAGVHTASITAKQTLLFLFVGFSKSKSSLHMSLSENRYQYRSQVKAKWHKQTFKMRGNTCNCVLIICKVTAHQFRYLTHLLERLLSGKQAKTNLWLSLTEQYIKLVGKSSRK